MPSGPGVHPRPGSPFGGNAAHVPLGGNAAHVPLGGNTAHIWWRQR